MVAEEEAGAAVVASREPANSLSTGLGDSLGAPAAAAPQRKRRLRRAGEAAAAAGGAHGASSKRKGGGAAAADDDDDCARGDGDEKSFWDSEDELGAAYAKAGAFLFFFKRSFDSLFLVQKRDEMRRKA